jgi:hypothetical protein
MVRLAQSLAVAGAASGSASAPRIALAAMMEVGLPPPSGGLVRGETLVWRHDGGGMLDNGG